MFEKAIYCDLALVKIFSLPDYWHRLRSTANKDNFCDLHLSLVFFTTRQVFCSDLHYTLAHCAEVIVTLWSLKTKLSFWWVVHSVEIFSKQKKSTNKYFWLTKNGLILQNNFHNSSFSACLNWNLAIDLSLTSNHNQIILVLRMAIGQGKHIDFAILQTFSRSFSNTEPLRFSVIPC